MVDVLGEKWALRRELKRLLKSKYERELEHASEEQIDTIARRYEADSAPMRARLNEIESTELIGRARSLDIVIADLVPLRFGNPLWREEAGCRYFSAEGKQTVEAAIRKARSARVNLWFSRIGLMIGLIGAITGLLAVVLRK